MGCNPAIAQSILDAGADYLLAVKDNQPTLHADIESYFATAPPEEVERVETVGKDHGRFEVRNHTVSTMVDWYAAERCYPGAPRFPQLTTIAMVESRIERGDKIETERRSYISSRALSAAAFADAARGHWAIENKLHWILDVTFNEDRSRLRTGHGAKNRHFALNLVRQVDDKRSIKRRRKRASWDPQYLLKSWDRCDANLDSLPWLGNALRDDLGVNDLQSQPGGQALGHGVTEGTDFS